MKLFPEFDVTDFAFLKTEKEAEKLYRWLEKAYVYIENGAHDFVCNAIKKASRDWLKDIPLPADMLLATIDRKLDTTTLNVWIRMCNPAYEDAARDLTTDDDRMRGIRLEWVSTLMEIVRKRGRELRDAA